MEIEDLSYKIIGAAIEVHRETGGPGLLESYYESALCHELTLRGIKVERQVFVPVRYKGVVIKEPMIVDVLVEDQIIVEVKSVEKDNPIFEAQLLTYLKITGIKLGLVINFGKSMVRDGISRVINSGTHLSNKGK